MIIKKSKISALLILILALAVGLISMVAAAQNNAPSDPIEKKAKNFIDNIKQNKDGGNNLKSLVDKTKDLSKFTNKYQVYNNTWGQNRWILENDGLLIETDDVGNPITFFNKVKKDQPPAAKYHGDITRLTDIKKLDKKTLLSIAKDVADKISKEEKVLVETTQMNDGYVAYKWSRSLQGYTYDTDFVLVILDPSDGGIVCMSKRFPSKDAAINIKISSDKAVEIAQNELMRNSSIEIFSVVKTELIIVNPNNYWKDKKDLSKFNDNARLAYAVTFKKVEPNNGEIIIWIDAESGKNIGGTQTR